MSRRRPVWFLAWVKTAVAFVTITLPVWIYAILSYTLTLQLNFVNLVTIAILSLGGAFLFVRFRWLNAYEEYRELPLGKPDVTELHPDVQGEEPPTTFHGYLDEFLSAESRPVYLTSKSKQVFHELARHLQTRRLIAGDSLALDEDQNFYCVIEGLVQVYAPTGRQPGDEEDGWADDEMNGYQLLNEVGSGGTLSSLFTILSLFTENVKLSWKEDEEEESSDPRTSEADARSAAGSRASGRPTNRMRRSNSDISNLDLRSPMMSPGSGPQSRPGFGGGRMPSYEDSPLSFVAGAHSNSGSNSSPMLGAYPVTPRTPGSRSQATAPSTPGTDHTYARRPPLHRQQTLTASQVRRGLVARASRDSTLAVIPAEAFRRLTKKFPKASAHIVQVILTRFSRVTFNAAHKYLGLTTEVLRTEKAINELACHPLPASFYEGGGMHNLRNKFYPDDNEAVETEDDTMTSASTAGLDSSSTIGLDSEDDYFGSNIGSWRDSPAALDPITPGPSSYRRQRRSQSRGSTFGESMSGLGLRGAPSASLTKSMSGKALSHLAIMAGDLHSSTSSVIDNTIDTYRPRSRTAPKTPGFPPDRSSLPTPIREAARLPAQRDTPPAGRDLPGAQADINLRDEVMACIAKSIGLLQPPLSDTPSGDASPVLVPFDTRSQSVASSRRGGGALLPNSFSTLSFLDAVADDGSSMTGTASIVSGHPYATGLDNEVEILCFAAGSTLVRAGERNAGLFYVIDGFLDVSLPVDEHAAPAASSSSNAAPPRSASRQSFTQLKSKIASSQGVRWGDGSQSAKIKNGTSSHVSKGVLHTKVSKHLFTVKPGGIAGYLASLSGTPSYVEIKAKVDTYVGFLPHHAMERLIERRPIVLLTLSKRLISLLSPLVLHIDSSLDWMQVNAGQVLWRPGDPSDSFYIVINGRLRALAEKEDGGVIGEYGQGDTVGELDVITRSNRTSTLHAIRDTELARMPQTLFNAISVRHPQAAVQLLRMVASRVRNLAQPTVPVTPKARPTAGNNNNFNLKTVAILPAARNVPASAFAKKLHSALEEIGASTVYLNQASMMNHVGRHAFTRMGKLKVAGWLADQEQRYRIVLYVADSPVSAPWTQTCIRQADYIMIVGMGDDPNIGEYERLLLTTKTTARKELVLLHPDRSVPQGSTREWLKIRPWVHAYHHVELPGIVKQTPQPAPEDPAAVKAFKDIKNIVQTEIKKYRGYTATPHSRRPDHLSDFARLARRICGKSIGLVLGGGGARGVAHLGILRALEERNIPIDHIGGTSIGSLVGGLYAREANLIQCSARVKAFGSRMSNIWRLLSDVTWPVVAYTTGHEFNRGIFKAFGALHIEDMWLPFFCNSTNILTSQMDIHDTGYAWRYVRAYKDLGASMTLVGLLPPICDNGNMLVDGGYLDNLPVSTMRSMGPNTIIAVDVGSLDDNSPRNFGDTVSGIWIAINRWNPFSSVRYIPPITEIQSRLAYVSSITSLEEAKNTPGCYYVQPPVQGYGTLQFNKYEELAEIGYKTAIELLDKWKEEGRLPNGFEDDFRTTEKLGKKRKGRSLRRNSV
ncbi:phosphatidylcholine and lysophosphatidylcholine phospholipase [Tulasnella sp. 427]|nr:phosphatidylcholine and lysophosphatidylcholine phospholipase [Tulasnella sp. 427]